MRGRVSGVHGDGARRPFRIVLRTRRASRLRHPDPAEFVQHGIVRAGHPGFLGFAIVVVVHFRAVALRVSGLYRHRGHGVLHRVQNPEHAAACAIGSIDFSIRVRGGIALVGGGHVMEKRFVRSPIPLRHHKVAFDAGGPRRSWRHFTCLDAQFPIDESLLQQFPANPVGGLAHSLIALEDAIEIIHVGMLARRDHAELMALVACAAEGREPMLLRGIPLGEIFLRRRMDHRRPIAGGINPRRFLRSRGIRDLELQLRAAGGRDLVRVLEPVPAHPHLIRPLRQIGDEKSPLIVSDDDLAERHLQFRFSDHPDAGFRLRAVRVQHDAANAGLIDLQSGSALRAACHRP